ncbi:hypothetical protein A2U01_0047605, partial [Trifolium medium]|nr:hypothetical protein [Trifolium medium]
SSRQARGDIVETDQGSYLVIVLKPLSALRLSEPRAWGTVDWATF